MPKVSVVVPAYITKQSQIDMTYKCIGHARKNTQVPFELIVVETVSDHLWIDDTDIYIHERQKTTCTKSINKGFKCASGDYVVLLTNDVFVRERWLECLLECFDKEDCGLSTLATPQLNHRKAPTIREGIWFSVAMMKKEDAWFDENFVNSWDDTDLITRVYLKGKKMYRNYNCLVDHLVGQTEYIKTDHVKNFERNKKYYEEKYKDYTNERIYQIFTKGVVV